jgi:enterochelin esterase family protein
VEVRPLSDATQAPVPRGTVLLEDFTSELLRGNPLGDPHVRCVPVYLPPGYEKPENASVRYPVIVLLTGYSSRGVTLLNDQPWQPNIARRMDRLIAAGAAPAILVMPDGFTRYGGSQYIDSAATGAYESHVVGELIPWLDRSFRTRAEPAGRAVMGKSSGGYGALVLGMRHADVFGAVVSHSGDMYFEYGYLPDFPKTASVISAAGGLEKFVAAFDAAPAKPRDWATAMNIVAMASCYSPDPGERAGFALPFDEKTGELRRDVFDRWLEHDPVRMIERHEEALRSLRLLWFDCGRRDEFNLHLGARIFAARLTAKGIPHTYDEFDAGHFDITWRYDLSLKTVTGTLSHH